MEPFDEHLSALDPADQGAVDKLAGSVRVAAAQIFGPFNDVEASPFYAVVNLSPQETWEQIAERVALVTVAAVAHGIAHRPISTATIARLHEIIFHNDVPSRRWASASARRGSAIRDRDRYQ